MQNRKKRVFPLIITILIMAFIFLQSALPAELSKEESGMIVRALIEFLHVDAEILSFAVRKCAHFTEYMVLGLSLYASVREYCPQSGEEAERGLTETAPQIRSGQVPGTELETAPQIRSGQVPGTELETTPQIRSGQLLRTALLSWGIGALYALTDEVHQSFVPGRSCEIRDILIDSCGVAAGVLIMAALRSRRAKS